MRQISDEAYTNPELVKTAPHNSTVHRTDPEPFDDPTEWAMTWRAYRRKVQEKSDAPASGSQQPDAHRKRGTRHR
jgi:glycine dehydrogenase subunit 2